MRKSILIIAMMGSVLFSIGQNKEIKFTENQKNHFEIYPVISDEPVIKESKKASTTINLKDENVGLSWYDLQTYNSLQRRMFTWPDGSMGITWAMAFTADSWTDLGTGYNYYDGQNWGNPPVQVIEENQPSSSPNYYSFGENGEIIVSHYYENHWKLALYTRETRGEGVWAKTILEGPEENVGIAWASVMVNGPENKTLHVLAKTTENPYMGQGSAFIYNRSTDGGITWDIQHEYFPELGLDNLNNVGRDAYTWAYPKGDTIAFTAGFATGNGYVMKSYDNGESWDQVTVYENPYSPYVGGPTPKFGGGDGTSAVALDSDGNAHVVFSRLVYYYDDESTMYYMPATEGLIYWNESMPMLDTTSVSSYTLEFLEEGGNLIGWVTGGNELLGFGTYYLSLTTWPQILIDEYDRIFVVYSGVSAVHHNEIMNYRHIYMNSSDNKGESWNGIEDLNQDLVYTFSECIFPAMSPKIEQSTVHVCFQEDTEIGLYVWIGQQQFTTDNIIRHIPVEVDSVVNIKENISDKYSFFSCYNYPNPFSKSTTIEIELKYGSDIIIEIHDSKGQLKTSVHAGFLEKGIHSINFENKNLIAGIYFYTLQTEFGSYSGKMVIK